MYEYIAAYLQISFEEKNKYPFVDIKCIAKTNTVPGGMQTISQVFVGNILVFDLVHEMDTAITTR
jgi:hypothetical protein